MAAKMDKEMMKKQHFWLLLIPLMIGLLLAWIGLFSGVAGATGELKKKNDDARNAIGNAKAQPKKVVDTYEGRKGELFELRTKKWKEMWEAQSAVYTWPKAIGEENIERLKDKQFGDNITNTVALEAFRDHYAKEYELIAKDVAPLQFAGGWRSVLRHVPQEQWLRVPEPEDVWLAMEDFWVQKDIVQALAKINTDSAKLYRVPLAQGATDDPMARSFANRTWQLDLKVAEGKQGSKKLVGSITNLTPRLQPYGANNQLLFNVWFSDDENAKPFVFSVQGSSMAGSTKAQITEVVTKHTIFEGNVREIARVEQIHDTRTAPIKRLDQLKMGYLSAKHSNLELQMTAFSQKAVDEANGMGMMGMDGGGMMGGGMFGAPPGGMMFGGPPGGMGGGPGAPGMVGAGNFGMGGGAAFMGGGFMGMAGGVNVNDLTYNRLERRRYLSRTEQVRAMPIAAAIVVDQSYTQDVLTALANSILRVQIVQMHMSRFRGNLSYDGTPSGGGFAGGMGFPMPPGGMGGGPGPMGFPPPPGGIRGFPAPPGGIMGGFPPPPGGMGGFPAPPGGIMGGFPRPPGGDDGFGAAGANGAPRNSSEDLASGNLVELSVYGIASLYEKFKPPEAKKDNTGLPMGVGPMVPMGMMGVPPTMPPMGMGIPPMGMLPAGIMGVPPKNPMVPMMPPAMPPMMPPAGMMGTPPPVPPKG